MLEFFGELFLEVYMELMIGLFPSSKGSKALKVIATVIAVVALVGIIAMVLCGIYLIGQGKLGLGIALTVLAVILSLVQIGLGVHFHDNTDES